MLRFSLDPTRVSNKKKIETVRTCPCHEHEFKSKYELQHHLAMSGTVLHFSHMSRADWLESLGEPNSAAAAVGGSSAPRTSPPRAGRRRVGESSSPSARGGNQQQQGSPTSARAPHEPVVDLAASSTFAPSAAMSGNTAASALDASITAAAVAAGKMHQFVAALFSKILALVPPAQRQQQQQQSSPFLKRTSAATLVKQHGNASAQPVITFAAIYRFLLSSATPASLAHLKRVANPHLSDELRLFSGRDDLTLTHVEFSAFLGSSRMAYLFFGTGLPPSSVLPPTSLPDGASARSRRGSAAATLVLDGSSSASPFNLANVVSGKFSPQSSMMMFSLAPDLSSSQSQHTASPPPPPAPPAPAPVPSPQRRRDSSVSLATSERAPAGADAAGPATATGRRLLDPLRAADLAELTRLADRVIEQNDAAIRPDFFGAVVETGSSTEGGNALSGVVTDIDVLRRAEQARARIARVMRIERR